MAVLSVSLAAHFRLVLCSQAVTAFWLCSESKIYRKQGSKVRAFEVEVFYGHDREVLSSSMLCLTALSVAKIVLRRRYENK